MVLQSLRADDEISLESASPDLAPESIPLPVGELPASPPRWWETEVAGPVLADPNWVSFDLKSIVTETLAHNPRIAALEHQTAYSMEEIVQQDAVFDPRFLLDSKYNSTSDPVGNTLTTGGPLRSQENSWNNRAGLIKTNRDGTRVDLSQQVGLLDSNSLFFAPANQGNTRLNLSVTRPLRAGSGRVYNERLILQARIDSGITIQQVQQEVQDRIGLAMNAYWRLYQSRCQLLQQRSLLQRGSEIEKVVLARRDFDSGPLEIAKVASRMARRRDQLIELERELRNLQTQLVSVVSSPALTSGQTLEMIPLDDPQCLPIDVDVRDAIVTAMSYRGEVRTAALGLETASLEISVTRNELLPQLDAVVGGYLAGLNGRNDIGGSFADQFLSGRPGFSGGLVYELPYGQRAARSRHRAAHQRYMEMSERYREAVTATSAEVETAARNLQSAHQRLETKGAVLSAAEQQETLVLNRWLSLGPEGRHAALVLEDLLDQQENRTGAERELVAGEVDYITALIELQLAMGTLLTTEGISSVRDSSRELHWIQDESIDPLLMIETEPSQ